jgi:hypothetical protein
MIVLVVDADRRVTGSVWLDFLGHEKTSHFKGVELRKQALDALANLVALGVEGAHFVLQGFDEVKLFAELALEGFSPLVGGGAGLAFALDQRDSPGNALFESGKIAAAHGEFSEVVVIVHFRRLGFGMFRDLGFQG